MSGRSDTSCQEFTTLSYLSDLAGGRRIKEEKWRTAKRRNGAPARCERARSLIPGRARGSTGKGGSAELERGAAEAGANLLHGVAFVASDGSGHLAGKLLVECNSIVVERLGESLASGLSLVDPAMRVRLFEGCLARGQIVRAFDARVRGGGFDRSENQRKRRQQIPSACVGHFFLSLSRGHDNSYPG